ncbi:MAG TPA: BspA family leucine-rich repeat surface protein, partial [Campylobacterales bacterium]|nr:BspA family leucine-rich repeat surface protein [Campylobacterales bacterium]
GTHDVNLTSDKTHTYSSVGEYTVSIFGKFPNIAFGKNSDGKFSTIENDARKLISIVQWGDSRWSSMEKAFMECRYLKGGATDKPNLSNVTTTKSMFYGALAFHDLIGDWDVSNITNMNSMFMYALSFNQNIGNWDVSKVTNMSNMFQEAEIFNQNIGNWDVSKVTDMNSMFKGAEKFNQDIGNWSIINVKSMKDMFSGVTLSSDIYDKILIGWNNQLVQSSVYFDGGDSTYGCDAQEARDNLINSHKWTIYDGGSSCDQHHQQEPYYDQPE